MHIPLVIYEEFHLQVYEAGKKEGLTGVIVWPPPLPVGAILRADWDRGVEDGLKQFQKERFE